ncbi:MAG: VCBS repeat-containing protein [Polyangiaceae bacterium]
MRASTLLLGVVPVLVVVACGSDSSSDSGDGGAGGSGRDGGTTLADGAVAPTEACKSENGTAPVASPVFVRNLNSGETGWFSSPAVADLDGDGKKEIVAPYYSTFVFDGVTGKKLATGTATQGRIYAPAVVGDIDGDGTPEIIVGGNAGTVAAYNYKSGNLTVKAGWESTKTSSGGQDPEARGMAAGDLDGDGKIEVAVTTTNTSSTGAQVFVFDSTGKSFQPTGAASTPAWPRYNQGSDLTFNGQGNSGYGCYGENVAIGNIDDDPDLEVIVTYDDHQINAFKKDGTSILASPWYTNPQTKYSGMRMGWGQFIRWFDPKTEDDHYHNDPNGPFPEVTKDMWLQWTASPPSIADIDGDGKNEVLGFPNAELHEPYVTQGYALMVLEGAYGDGSNSARRNAAFQTLPMSDAPVAAGDYPPLGIPAPTVANIVGDAKPEILAPLGDGYVYAYGPDGTRLWRYDFAHAAAKTYASEVTVADLDKDGTPEIIFGTYSLTANGGHLIVLANTGALLFDITLTNQGNGGGNGIGVPAAPTIADIDGDGSLEILLTTFDHGTDIYNVPGSGTSCLLWPTGRGNYLRSGTGAYTTK